MVALACRSFLIAMPTDYQIDMMFVSDTGSPTTDQIVITTALED